MAEVKVPSIEIAKPVALGVNPVPQSGLGGMSLGDIVNMATTTQAFQKQKELMPYQIEAGKAEAQRAQLEAEKAGVDLNQHYANITRGLMGGFLSDPDFINGNSEKMAKKIEEASAFAQKMGVRDTGGVTQQLIEIAKKDPAAAYQYIKNGVQQAGGAAAQYTTQQQYQAPQVYQYGGAQQPQGAQPTGVTPDQMSRPASQQQPQGMRLNFQPRQAGDVRPVAPGEAEEAKLGQQYLAGLNDFGVNAVSYKRNIDEVIAEAKKIEEKATFPTAGVLGAAERKTGAFFGTEQGVRYKQLSKDLANVQIAALKAAGADLQTDAGKQLVRMANGDETFPPEVLINIANRTKADITNVELQRQAAAQFNQRYPGYANFGAFKQAWADNADSQVFQMMNAEKEIKDPAKLNSEFAKIMKLPSDPSKYTEEQRQKAAELMTKYRNIKKLVGTGAL